jgi:DNA-binding Lrp family transcriptional regulator
MFKTIDQLNESVRIHKRNPELNDTDRAVLDLLARYSCKELGKSWLAKGKIAELVGKSRRTIIRVCNKLEKLGIIRQYERRRETGDRRQSSNLIVIQPADVTPECHSQETPTRNSKNNTYKDTAFVPATALQNSLPSAIYDAMSPYFNAEELYRYYGILLRAKRSVSNNVLIEDNPQPFVTAFQNAILKLKQRKIRNLANYLYRAWQSATATIVRRRVFDKSDLFYDWLGAD